MLCRTHSGATAGRLARHRRGQGGGCDGARRARCTGLRHRSRVLVVVPADHVPAGLHPSARTDCSRRLIGSSPDARRGQPHAAGRRSSNSRARSPADAPRAVSWSRAAPRASSNWPVPGIGLDDLQRVESLGTAIGRADRRGQCRASATVAAQGRRTRAAHCVARRTLALMISDVPGDDPRVIGSGLLHARLAVCRGRARGDRDVAAFREIAASSRMRGEQRAGRRAAHSVRSRGVARVSACTRPLRSGPRRRPDVAARLRATYRRRRHRSRGDASRRDRAAASTCGMCRSGRRIDGALAGDARSRRSQPAPCAAAPRCELDDAGCTPRTAAAVGGTDGIDGVTTDAGALVDAAHVPCADATPVSTPTQSLARADSGTFLEAAGDLLHTGPT